MSERQRLTAMFHTMLHVEEIDASEKNKIEPFVNTSILCSNFTDAFKPFTYVSTDKMITGR